MLGAKFVAVPSYCCSLRITVQERTVCNALLSNVAAVADCRSELYKVLTHRDLGPCDEIDYTRQIPLLSVARQCLSYLLAKRP